MDAPPPVPTEFQIYNSYEEDPKWQRKFTAIWAAVAGAAILLSLPHLIKSIRRGHARNFLTGVTENYGASYEKISDDRGQSAESLNYPRYPRVYGLIAIVKSAAMWTPAHVGLDVGQIVLVVAYYAVLLCCITIQAPLIDNPNRAGFLAIAQLPVVFLFATKNSLLSLALGAGRGYEKINFLHRWAGRGMFLSATVHGSLWIRNHLQYGLPILGQQKETSGVACYGLLCVLILSSLRPVRVWCYQVFYYIHILGFVALYITICYHTIYASPWILPPLGFYGLDLLLRMIRVRVKDASLVACDNQMTIIKVNDCDSNWAAGQHVRLRVFFDWRVFESHPLTILSAPTNTSCLSNRGLLLGARANGDWTKALNAYAMENGSLFSGTVSKRERVEVAIEETDEHSEHEKVDVKRASISSASETSVLVPDLSSWTLDNGAQVQVMLDGPYGGSSVDLGDYENVFLVAGGSGITFTLGLLDDIVGRCAKRERLNGERTRSIEFVWCIRSFGCIKWFAPMLNDIAVMAESSSIDLHISVFVTCLCNPEAVPPIPNCDVLIERPTMYTLLSDLVLNRAPTPGESEKGKARVPSALGGRGLAVCAAGPETMTREAKNALALMSLSHGSQLGKVGCHTELYSL